MAYTSSCFHQTAVEEIKRIVSEAIAEGDISVGGGGGGSSTYAGLTDAATVNLPTVNTPLASALAGKFNVDFVGDFSTRPTVGLTEGDTAFLYGDINSHPWGGLFWVVGGQWRPMHPVQIYQHTSLTSGVNSTTAAQTLFSIQLPAGLLMSCDTIDLRTMQAKSGTTTTSTVNLRLGTTGTSADTSFLGSNAITASNRVLPTTSTCTMVDATTIRQLSRAVAGFSGASTTAFPQDVTISSAAGSLYLSIDHTLTATGSDIPQVGAVLLTLN